jgi:hypothetical protein
MATKKRVVAPPKVKPAKTGNMPSRARKSKALKIALRNDTDRTVVKTGTVTAVRWDGSVNLRMNGQHFVGVACAQSYADRKAGDRVQVLMHGGMPYVMGAVGGDPSAPAPDFFSTDAYQYTWGLYGETDRDQRIWVNEGVDQRVGRPGDLEPVYGEKDSFYQVAYSYWDGTNNLLNDAATPETSIDLFVVSDWDEGDPGPARLTLWGHRHDVLPESPQTMLLNALMDPPSIDFTLEAGELKVITLPDEWRDSIGADVLTNASIRGFLITPAAPEGEPNAVENSYAMLSTVTGGVRVYTQ